MPRMARATGPGPRSMDVLDWVARVGTATVPAVSAALGLSEWTTYGHVRRLVDAGLMERWPTLQHEPALLTVTKKGARELGRPWVGQERMVPSQWRHYVATAGTAAWLATHPECRWWRHEREFATTEPPAIEPRGPESWTVTYTGRKQGRVVELHRRPDLVAGLGGQLTAIEVERTAKGAQRLAAIVKAWGLALERGRVDRVIYVVADEYVRGAVAAAREAAAREVPAVTPKSLVMVPLDELPWREVPAGSLGTGGAVDAEPRPGAVRDA